uniref:Putative ribonuclease H-like domain-containing protein n=1 Tax=Tanacetum cinerariifolium TaxID=118510 RepID=A0A6L2L421_TANCI|nr:putative ribonuclease H-like domain-containing protein [Tanacetum cinerariifolium]
MSVRTKRGLGLDKYIGEGEFGIDDSKFSIFYTNSDELEGQPIYNRFALVDHMKALPPPLTGNYMPPSNIPDIDESQMVYGKKATDSSEIKTNDDSISHSNDSILFHFSYRSSESSTNVFQMCDFSVECSRPNHSDHDSTDSISSVSSPASESRDTIVIDCDRQEDFPSVCTSSIETDVKSSKTLCNKFGSFNKESHFRKHKSVALKSCYVCGSYLHLINNCDFHEQRLAKRNAEGKGILGRRPTRKPVHPNRPKPASAGQQNPVSASQPNPVSAGQQNPVSAGEATLACNSIPLSVSAGDGILGPRPLNIQPKSINFHSFTHNKQKIIFLITHNSVYSLYMTGGLNGKTVVKPSADSFLPTIFWTEAVATACYVLNRVLVTKPHDKTPYELLIGDKPSISYLKPFGYHVTILNTSDPLGKFDKKSDEGYIIGYSISSKAYRVYNLISRKIYETINLKFLENKPFVAGTGQAWMFDIDYLTESLNYSRVSRTNLTAGSQGATPSNAGSQEDDSDSDDKPDVLIIQSTSTLVVPIVNEATTQNDGTKSDHAKTNADNLDELAELQALQRQEQAGKEEADRLGLAFPSLNPILGVGTASIGSSISAGSTPPISDGSTPLMSLCASPIYDDRHSISAGKSHVSAGRPTGFAGRPIFAGRPSGYADRTPVPAGRILGKFIASASSKRFPRASNVENSDIHDGLKIFDCPKSGIFTSSSYDKEFSCLDANNLESSLDVSSTITKRIHNIHLTSQALADPDWVKAMQAKMQQFRNQKVWVLIRLPDGKQAIGTKWIFKNKRDARAKIEAIRLFLAFASFMGFMVYQMDVKSAFLYGKIAEEVYVTQPRGFEDPDHPKKVYKVVKALYGLHQAPRACVHLYRSMIGCLMYLTATRPDIMLAVCVAARHQVTTKTSNLLSVKRIFKYLTAYPKLGLWYPRDSPFDLKAFSDSDYAGNPQPVDVSFLGEASEVSLPDGVRGLVATIDGTAYTVTEASIRSALQLDDLNPIDTMTNEEIFAGLRDIGNIAIALICLSTGRKYNFSNMIFNVAPHPSPDPMPSPPRQSSPLPIPFGPAPTSGVVSTEPIPDIPSSSEPVLETITSPFRDDDTGGSSFHESLPRPHPATQLSRIATLEAELKATKILHRDTVVLFATRIKKLESKLKTKKRKLVLIDSENEEEARQSKELDALLDLANAALHKPSLSTTPSKPANPEQSSEQEISPTTLDAVLILSQTKPRARVATLIYKRLKKKSSSGLFFTDADIPTGGLDSAGGMDSAGGVDSAGGLTSAGISVAVGPTFPTEPSSPLRDPSNGKAIATPSSHELNQSIDVEQVYLDSLLAQRVAKEQDRESMASEAQMVELMNRRRKAIAEMKAKAKREKPMTPA